MNQTTALTPTERFAFIIEALCQGLSRHAGIRGSAFGWLPGPFLVLVLIWMRLRRLKARFNTLAARPARLAPSPAGASRPSQSYASRPHAPLPLPQGFAWLLRLVPESACGLSRLQSFLGEPETLALLAAKPELGRILRPLCRMLGLRPPTILRLPNPRPSRATAPDAATREVIHNPPPLLPAPRVPPPAPPRPEFSPA